MKRLYGFSVAFGVALSVFVQEPRFDTSMFKGQKPAIDTSAYGKFPEIGAASITDNGEYLYYEIQSKDGYRLSIRGIHNAWDKEIPNVQSQVSFANEGHLLVTKRGPDTLCLQTL